MSPDGRLGLALPSGRRPTAPVTLMQYSLRRECATDLVADDDLDDAAGLAQVEERNPAVIAPPGHPAGEGDGLADVLGAQGAGVVGADHCCSLVVVTARGRRSSWGGAQVSGSAATWSPLRMSLTW